MVLGWTELKYGLRLKKLLHEARERIRQRRLPEGQRGTEDPREASERRKHETWMTLTDPSHSTLAHTTIYFIAIVILASTVGFILETVPTLERSAYWSNVFFVSETIFVLIFTVEFLLRFWATPQTTGEFMKEPLNVIDLLSIAPFYVELVIVLVWGVDGTLMDLRLLRAFRLMRMLKMGRHSHQLQFMGEGVVRSKKSFVLLFSMLLLGIVLFSALIWTVERGVWSPDLQCYTRAGEPFFSGCSPFETVPMGLWWAMTTMTTVGYGDAFPITVWGKMVGGCAMLCGILCIALPTTLLSVEFFSLYQERSGCKYREPMTESELASCSKAQLELYVTMHEFDNLRKDLDETMHELKLLTMVKAQELDEPCSVDPMFTMFHKQGTANMSNMKEISKEVCGGLIS